MSVLQHTNSPTCTAAEQALREKVFARYKDVREAEAIYQHLVDNKNEEAIQKLANLSDKELSRKIKDVRDKFPMEDTVLLQARDLMKSAF